MESSYLMSKGKALEAFPMLKQDGLVGALVYYDGQIFFYRGCQSRTESLNPQDNITTLG